MNEEKVFQLIKSTRYLSITQISEMCKLSRATVRIILAKLEGAQKVVIKKVGMAKLYSLNPEYLKDN